MDAKHIVVIGAGVIGATVALALQRDGHRVTIVEPSTPGGIQAASHGNGAFLSPASIIPMSIPGLWKKVPGYLLDPTGALTIRWRHLLRLSPWLMRFLLSGWTPARVGKTAAALAALLAGAQARHRALAEGIGRPELIVQKGLIYAFADKTAFENDSASWALRRRFGVRMQELDGTELHALLPDLSQAYQFAILLTDGAHCTNPGGYVAALVAAAVAQGADMHRARATGFSLRNGRLIAVETDAGALACDGAVIASGARSKALARAAGDRISLESERGYYVEIADPAVRPAIPVMPQDGKMANVLTETGLRASGQVELASADAAPDWRRADILLGHLKRAWPALDRPETDAKVSRWQGNRPSTPDGRPVICVASGCRQIIHAFGHGHIGLASAPMTAEIVADLIADRPPAIDIAPFAATRF
ncbi:NAD(P)/FAD-dependent oxidoreductase [Phaeovulum sp. W22_SRMD_FR3]|uniref:NAD(P)/FAD-dependent oxidoreductase n=1 Tax=Phaeovulum sp. W22_SRMD_FR3 TaxID=3240274 RepID=UPI003F94427D